MADTTIQPVDLMGYLYRKWLEQPEPPDHSIETFVKFARSLLLQNTPVSFDYRSNGIGITLKNMDRVPFVPDVPGEDDYQMYQGEIAITSVNKDQGFNFPNGMYGWKV